MGRFDKGLMRPNVRIVLLFLMVIHCDNISLSLSFQPSEEISHGGSILSRGYKVQRGRGQCGFAIARKKWVCEIKSALVSLVCSRVRPCILHHQITKDRGGQGNSDFVTG